MNMHNDFIYFLIICYLLQVFIFGLARVFIMRSQKPSLLFKITWLVPFVGVMIAIYLGFKKNHNHLLTKD